MIHKPNLHLKYSRSITPLTASQFSDALFSALIIRAPPADLGTEEQIAIFNFLCANILVSIAPYKVGRVKVKLQPWFNNLLSQAGMQESRT